MKRKMVVMCLVILASCFLVGRHLTAQVNNCSDCDGRFVNERGDKVKKLTVKRDLKVKRDLFVDGNVGIGTTSPGDLLEVASDSEAAVLITTFSSAQTYFAGKLNLSRARGTMAAPSAILLYDVIGGIYTEGYGATDWGGGPGIIFFARENWTDTAQGSNISFYTNPNGTILDWEANPNAAMVIDHTGDVGIGTEVPNYPLEMGSGAHVTAGGVWTNASSREYKENIQDLSVNEAMATLVKLRPSRFNYKVDKEDEYLGFIAEDVPDLVATKDRKGLSPMDIVAVLTRVVQQQQKKIEELEARFNNGQ